MSVNEATSASPIVDDENNFSEIDMSPYKPTETLFSFLSVEKTFSQIFQSL